MWIKTNTRKHQLLWVYFTFLAIVWLRFFVLSQTSGKK